MKPSNILDSFFVRWLVTRRHIITVGQFDSTHNNNEQQQFNDDKERVCNGQSGVGMCKSGFEGFRVEVLTSSANTTSTRLRATTINNGDDNDDNIDSTTSHSIDHTSANPHQAGEGSSSRYS